MLPDLLNPRVWLRESIAAFSGWLWKRTPRELAEDERKRAQEWARWQEGMVLILQRERHAATCAATCPPASCNCWTDQTATGALR